MSSRVAVPTPSGSGFALRPSEVPARWPILGRMGPRRHARLETDVSQPCEEPPRRGSRDPGTSLPTRTTLQAAACAARQALALRPGTLPRTALLPPSLSLSIRCTQVFVASPLLPSHPAVREGSALSAEVLGDEGRAGDPWGTAEGLVLIWRIRRRV